ncbi:nuclear transport factor 2 family protein [Rhodococcus sp. C26F]|jgi:3-phenylpropionate/cinnamic acid dioxygenase small subunit|uniref:nuclear transport factor 2 family protein n=1 Tax=Rhodococcus pyridinivorans TaxID=103816 RepID=UPI000BA1D9AF|nr:nuclear transport factor 2 family protein [Rhodococcus pyridinivorans]MCD5421158.1 nuclear transport factor 2 family protein [Rhodococcus pyridinivorans]
MQSVSVEVGHRAERLLYDYAAAVDTGDLTGLRELITDDVVIEQNGKSDVGAEEFIGVYRAFIDSPVEFSRHAISNVRVVQGEDGRVHVDAYFEATVCAPGSNQRIYGRYADVYIEREGTLLIDRKGISVDRMIDLPAGEVEYQPY